MQKTGRSWFNGKDEVVLVIALCVIGVIIAIPGYQLLNQFPYNSGKNLIGFYVPPVFTVAYFTYVGFRYKLSSNVLVKALLIFLLLVAPYAPLFSQVFQPTPNDDFGRYYLYAQNMYINHTLWGGDKLYFKDSGYHYVTQPGYRYLIYFELLGFRNLYRYVQLINIGVYVVTVYYFQKTIYRVVAIKKLLLCLLLLTFLISPYIIKNVLMGLPEWFTIILLMWFCYFHIASKQRGLAIFLLGLAPFFRQNLVICALLLFGWIVLTNKRRLLLSILFLLPLLLPLYHNLYYAGEWKFFVDIFKQPYLTYNDHHEIQGIKYTFIGINLLHYVGIDYVNRSFSFPLIAAFFVPFATIIYFWLIKFLPNKKFKITYLIITMSAIIPTILLGSYYYPRFESVNVVVMVVTFIILYFSKSEGLKLVFK